MILNRRQLLLLPLTAAGVATVDAAPRDPRPLVIRCPTTTAVPRIGPAEGALGHCSHAPPAGGALD